MGLAKREGSGPSADGQEEAGSMLGEVISEMSGQTAVVRVLEADSPSPKMEASLQGAGKLLGHDATSLATYWMTFRAGGELYGEGKVVFMTDEGVASWVGFGIGKMIGPGSAASWAVCGNIQTASPALARLNGVATVSDYDQDEDGNWTWVLREWKCKADG